MGTSKMRLLCKGVRLIDRQTDRPTSGLKELPKAATIQKHEFVLQENSNVCFLLKFCGKVSNAGKSLLFVLPGHEEDKGERGGLIEREGLTGRRSGRRQEQVRAQNN